jgi:hypothetical protein
MLATRDDLLIFWMTPWSAPLRDACIWIARFGAPISGKRPDSDAPQWVRPLFLQRWVAQAIAARLAWLDAHPDLTAPRFEEESEPRWDESAWTTYDRRGLRERCDAALLEAFSLDVERLLYIVQEAPSLIGLEWTRAILGASERIARIYAELRRRYKAARARAMLREELGRFVTWQRDDAASGSAMRESR